MKPQRTVAPLVVAALASAAGAADEGGGRPVFVDRADALGVDFRHHHFGTGQKYMPENMGPGVAVLDYDGDGRLDLYFPQGRPWPEIDPSGVDEDRERSGPEAGEAQIRVGGSEADAAGDSEGGPVAGGAVDASPGGVALTGGGGDLAAARELRTRSTSSAEKGSAIGRNRLYRQAGDGRFVDVTESAGVGDDGHGMGAATGDYDDDGDPDLYLTNYGPNVLYRNNGDGTFTDVTESAGVGSPLWSMSSAFFDYESDGDLDLFVVNYVDFGPDNHKWCGSAQRDLRSYCHPDVYDGLRDQLYRNNGDGTFTEISEASGVHPTSSAKGLGLMVADFDDNRVLDLFVANDSTANQLYLARPGGNRFGESGLLAGVAVNASGVAEASMGVEYGDVDGDGEGDLFITHLDEETNTLYRGLGGGQFLDVTDRSGLAGPSLPWVGFGTAFVDHDLDGDLDLFVANGHIIDNIELFDAARSHRQPAQLFENDGRGHFSEVTNPFGALAPLVARGVAAADLDRDGDVDLVVSENGGPVHLLMRARPVGSEAASGLRVILRARRGDPFGAGARLELTTGEDAQVRWIKPASSYLSQSPREAWFAIDDTARPASLEIRWPDGRSSRVRLPSPRGSLTIWRP